MRKLIDVEIALILQVRRGRVLYVGQPELPVDRGDLAFDRSDGSLWGIRTLNGICSLVRIPRPYREWQRVVSWPYGIVVYDLEKLACLPTEVAHDFPGGEWRRIQRAQGYRFVLVNGEVTIEDDRETGIHPGRLLRHGAM